MNRLSLVLIIVFAMAGCETPASRPPTDPGPIGAATEAARWPYRPAAMRFHPLTRITAESADATALIEARIEFADRDGMTTRCSGRVEIDLLTGDPRNPVPSDRHWDIDLVGLDANSTHFDKVTRTYLFKLRLDRPAPADSVLRAVYASAGDRELRARLAVGGR